MGLLMGPPGTGPPSSSSSRLCVAAGLLSGFSLGRRRGSTLRATETAESLECLNRRPDYERRELLRCLFWACNADRQIYSVFGLGLSMYDMYVPQTLCVGPRLAKESDQSWLDQLSPDPETDLHVPNTDPREAMGALAACKAGLLGFGTFSVARLLRGQVWPLCGGVADAPARPKAGHLLAGGC